MNRLPFIIIFSVLFFASLAVFFQTDDVIEPKLGKERLQIAVTIFPLYDIVRNITGNSADVELIVPLGVSPHTFEIAPIQMRKLQSTDILFQVGLLDEWVSSIVINDAETKIISLSSSVDLLPFRSFDHAEDMHSEDDIEEVHEHEGHDPHYWLSVPNAKKMAEQIYEVLVISDAKNSRAYAYNLQEYTKKLDILDTQLRDTFRYTNNNNLITFHDSWQYFESEYGLKTVAVVESSPGADLLPDDLKNIHEIVEEYNITAIFSEPQLSIDQIKPLIEDLNLTEYILDPLGGVGEVDSYISMMQYNADSISKALIK